MVQDQAALEVHHGAQASFPHEEIGKTLTEDLYLQEVVDFVPIAATLDDLAEKIVKDLSRDQLLLSEYAKATISGHVPPSVAAQKPVA